ncbi:MAG: hypothetical protein E4H03_13810, partial [Myxococcales bacterium]
MKITQLVTMAICAVLFADVGRSALAQDTCGDVTGDERVTITDALVVLQKATGLDPPTTCPAGPPAELPPSEIRYFNSLQCTNGATNSRTLYIDNDANALVATPNDYSTPITWTEPDAQFFGDICGLAQWETLNDVPLPQNRRLAVIELVLETEIYDPGDLPFPVWI